MTDTRLKQIFTEVRDDVKKSFPELSGKINDVQFKIGQATRTFGTAQKRGFNYTIRMSRVLCDTEKQAFSTMRHEWGHIVDYMTRGTSDHSATWKNIARKCGLENPKRCSKVGETAAKKATTIRKKANGGRGRKCQVYVCNCMHHIQGRKLKYNGAYHTCKKCKANLKYMGATYRNYIEGVAFGSDLNKIQWIERPSYATGRTNVVNIDDIFSFS